MTEEQEKLWSEFLAAAAVEWQREMKETGASQLGAVATSARLAEKTPAQAAGSGKGAAVTESLAGAIPVLSESPVWRAVSGESSGGAAAAWRSVLGVIPRALISLFGGGGGDEKDPVPLVKYALPPRMRFEAADGPGASLRRVDYGQDGLPRAYTAERPREPAGQVTIQVQAMDSQSFLDHKEEIARAVREAMLNTHALNDVVGEL